MFFSRGAKYYKMTDAQLEREASKWHIKEYGNRNGSISRKAIIDQLLARDSASNSDKAIAISIISLLISVGGFFSGLYLIQKQVDDFQNSANSRQIDYALNFSDRLTTGTNYKISLAIEENKPLLKQNRGVFNTSDLDLFLGVYNQLDDAYKGGLVSEDVLYNNFSDGLLRAYKNQEIQRYLKTIRQEDSAYFQGFDELASVLSQY